MPTRACLGALLKAENFFQVVPTTDLLCVAAPGQNRLERLWTGTTRLAAGLLARMASRAIWSHPLAFLEALVLLVARVVGMAGPLTDVATIKAGLTRLGAAALGKHVPEVLALVHLLCIGGVLLTHQLQPTTQQAGLAHVGQNIFPENRFAAELDEVAYAVESMAGSGKCNADPVVDAEESDGALDVAANEGQEDDVVLLTLVIVHYGHLHPHKLLFWHLLLESEQLPGVGGEDRDL